MSVIAYLFSFLCSQDASRSFAVAGHLLPVCQRCAGLYMGMGVTFVYLLLKRGYRKNLPPRSIVYVNVACLLAMPIFGFHLLDPGPAWRLWSGLVYGNAIVSLLVPAASIISNEGGKTGCHTEPSTTSFWIFFAFLNSVPLWCPAQSVWFYYAGLLFMLVGLLCVAFCVSVVTVFLIKKLLMSVMSSAKLQVRPILLKKISFMIFFNNYLSGYDTIRCHRKEKIKKRFFLF